MSAPILLSIMIVIGVLGGLISWMISKSTNKLEQELIKKIFMGLGATLLVPLFLEFSKSEILNDLTMSWSIGTGSIIKNYLLYISYCLIASISADRFINKIIDSVLNRELKEEKGKRLKLEEKIKQKEKYTDKIQALNNKNSKEEQSKKLKESDIILMTLAPITIPEDPQKGRFGGQYVRNNRELKATVKADTEDDDWFTISLRVEPLSDEHPLNSDVVFYLHDTFRPSIITVKPDEFVNGKAVLDKSAYGAFTVGVVTDKGETLLELDLAENNTFPKKFRER